MDRTEINKMKRRFNLISRAFWGNKVKQAATRLLTFVCLWLFTSSLTIASAQTHTEDEPLIKAAFIYNFAKFTSWPENIWQDSQAPLKLCTVGKDALVSELKHLAGKTIQQHPVTVHPLKNMQAVKNCQLLYIATSEKKQYTDILKVVQDKPVLTISELANFENSGGIIRLYRDKSQHFIINLGVAREAGLVLSSRLLNVARVINHEGAQ